MKRLCLVLVAFLGLNLCAAEVEAVNTEECKSAECVNNTSEQTTENVQEQMEVKEEVK